MVGEYMEKELAAIVGSLRVGSVSWRRMVGVEFRIEAIFLVDAVVAVAAFARKVLDDVWRIRGTVARFLYDNLIIAALLPMVFISPWGRCR